MIDDLELLIPLRVAAKRGATMPDRQSAVHHGIGRPPGRGTMRAFIVSALILAYSLFLVFVLSSSTVPGSGPLEGANLFAFIALCAFWVAFWSGAVWLITAADPHSRI
jgi:hypothetical protein